MEPTHMLEGRTTLLGLKRMSRNACYHGCRFLSIGDNLSSLLAFEKGRACDWGLRCLTRVAAARQIACEIHQYHRYSETERNPTDHDSRAVERGEISSCQVVHGRGVVWPLLVSPPPTRPSGVRLPIRLAALLRPPTVASSVAAQSTAVVERPPPPPASPRRPGHFGVVCWLCSFVSLLSRP